MLPATKGRNPQPKLTVATDSNRPKVVSEERQFSANSRH
ncbi:hypothetical protein [Pseudomonas fluorescens]|nr:hypothetical protein [Pseudomonas fluorescens]